MKTRYDKSTDSLYVELRPLPSRRTIEIEEDMLDRGEDGEAVGYDIQHASTKAEFIGRLILEKSQVAPTSSKIWASRTHRSSWPRRN